MPPEDGPHSSTNLATASVTRLSVISPLPEGAGSNRLGLMSTLLPLATTPCIPPHRSTARRTAPSTPSSSILTRETMRLQPISVLLPSKASVQHLGDDPSVIMTDSEGSPPGGRDSSLSLKTTNG